MENEPLSKFNLDDFLSSEDSKSFNLIPNEVLILMFFNLKCDKNGQSNETIDNIINYTRLSKSSVIRTIKSLLDKRLILKNKESRNNNYTINIQKGVTQTPIKVENRCHTDTYRQKIGVTQTPIKHEKVSHRHLSPTKIEEDTINNIYNNINNNIYIKSILSDDQKENRSRFEEFWEEYPRKDNKKKANQVWLKNNLDKKADIIISDVKNRSINHVQWQNPQFVPMPTTYLNGEKWNDSIISNKEIRNGINNQQKYQQKPLTHHQQVMQRFAAAAFTKNH